MKKVFLIVAMLFAVSVSSFAEDNNAAEIERMERYDVSVNAKRLGEYLQLTTDQYDAVETVVGELSNDLKFAAVECNDSNRVKVTKNAVDKNVKYMSYILNKEQYHRYLTVLNATITNRRIDINE